MKVCGFTFIRNAITYDYPVVEAIRSILPICHEVIVAVGNSDDDTLQLIQHIDPKKIKIIETQWDESLREGGRVLAAETNKALSAIASDADWAVYVQGDEVYHEADYPEIVAAMQRYKDDEQTDGLLFRYLHFYGSYHYVGASENWYKNEIRVIKPNRGIYSFRDAQGFRKGQNELLRVRPLKATIHHYGWVKDPRVMQKKQAAFNRLWHSDEWVEKHVGQQVLFEYEEHVEYLKPFEGTHPGVMLERIERLNWAFDHDVSMDKRSFKNKIKAVLNQYLGLDFSYKNYRLLN